MIYQIGEKQKNEDLAKEWSKILLLQHEQLITEVTHINRVIESKGENFNRLDAKIQRFVKGIRVHLALEHNFFKALLPDSGVSAASIRSLLEGYQSLNEACDRATRTSGSLILLHKQDTYRERQFRHIKDLLSEIMERLLEEDNCYSALALEFPGSVVNV